MATQISPHYSDQKLEHPTIDDLIDVFEDRVRYWIFEPAKTLLGIPDGFVAATSLVLTYFEAYSICRKGEGSEGKSKQFFREAFLDVFGRSNPNRNLLGRVADLLYEDARCGFFHDGIFRDRILFADTQAGELVITVPKINGKPDESGPIQSGVINPRRFCRAVEDHFTRYVRTLRDSSNLQIRENFKKGVDISWHLDTPGPIVGVKEGAL